MGARAPMCPPYRSYYICPCLQGPSSIHATNSSLEAEAHALFMTVQQMWTLAYQIVVFMSDGKLLIDELNQV